MNSQLTLNKSLGNNGINEILGFNCHQNLPSISPPPPLEALRFQFPIDLDQVP